VPDLDAAGHGHGLGHGHGSGAAAFAAKGLAVPLAKETAATYSSGTSKNSSSWLKSLPFR
jgi:hypothetical protein